jgi:DNA-3-methyladenine glycosylase II
MESTVEEYLYEADDKLAEIINKVELPELKSTHNLFHDLMSCVIEQQIHYRSSKKQFAKMLVKTGLEELTVDNFSQFEEVALSGVKLSTRKFETIARVVDFFRSSPPDWNSLDDISVVKTLTSIKGIGAWTADMILLYTLERPDVFTTLDYHLKKLMAELYEIPEKNTAEMKLIAESWRPYRSYGMKYLFAWKEARKNRKI